MRILGIVLVSSAALAAALPSSPALAKGGVLPPRCRQVPAALSRQNAAARRTTVRLLHNTNYTPVVRTFTPKITHTREFTGYGSIVVRSPKGTAPVAGFFVLRGADRCAITITSAQIVLRRHAYVLNFAAPGEQGNPGRVTITLVSR